MKEEKSIKLINVGGAFVPLQPQPTGKMERMKGDCDLMFKRKSFCYPADTKTSSQ